MFKFIILQFISYIFFFYNSFVTFHHFLKSILHFQMKYLPSPSFFKSGHLKGPSRWRRWRRSDFLQSKKFVQWTKNWLLSKRWCIVKWMQGAKVSTSQQSDCEKGVLCIQRTSSTVRPHTWHDRGTKIAHFSTVIIPRYITITSFQPSTYSPL